MKRLIDILDEGGYSCVIAQGDHIRTFTRRGVADLYDLLQEDAAFLHEASVADKVIGKAAATLMVLGQVKEVSVHTISQPALRLLQEAGIPVQYDEAVHHIINRDCCRKPASPSNMMKRYTTSSTAITRAGVLLNKPAVTCTHPKRFIRS